MLKKYRGEFIKEENNKKFLDKFCEEIKILYDLNHQNIVRIYDYSIERKAWYIMEYVDGSNIAEYVKEKPNNLIKIFLQVINVFSFLEIKDICHRDIRINNMLVNKEGVLKIIDFGFGKIIENNGTLKSATKMINYPFSLPKELNCDEPKYNKKTEIYFVGKLLKKLIKDNNIKNFPYENIINQMIIEEPQDRIVSFTEIKNKIREITNQNTVVPHNLKQNYQELVFILNHIIISKRENSIIYDYNKIIDNLNNLIECNQLNDKLENAKYFAECFISNLGEYYTERKEVSIKYIEQLIEWLKSLKDNEKEQFIKNLHFKLLSYDTYQDLPF